VGPLKRSKNGSGALLAISLAHFANDAPLTLLPAVLPIVINEFNLSYAASGAIIAVSGVSMTSLQAITGYVADRMNRITLLFAGLATVGIGTILVSLSTNYIQLLVFQCLVGVGASIYHPVGYSLLSDTFESKNRGKALGLGSAAGDVAIPLAFGSSGFLAFVLGWRNIFLLWGLVTVIVAVVVPLILAEPRQRKVHLTNASRSTRQIITTLIPTLVVMGLAGASYKIVTSFTTTYLTTFGLDIDLANTVVALMMGIGTVGAVVGGTLTDRLGERNAILLTSIMLGMSSAVTAIVGNVYVISIMMCVSGFALLGVWPPFYSVIASSTNLGARAFIYGLLFAISWSFGSLFPYVSGVSADIFGLPIVYLIVSFVSLLTALIAQLTLKKHDRSRTFESQE